MNFWSYFREGSFVQQVIKSVVEKRMQDIPGSLTYQDIFFREVFLTSDRINFILFLNMCYQPVLKMEDIAGSLT